MIVTAELNLYPLSKDFESKVIAFIKVIKTNNHVQCWTHSMSTYIKGESTEVFKVINEAYERIGEDEDTATLIIKMVNRSLPIEDGYLKF